jgi:hypothetical protein
MLHILGNITIMILFSGYIVTLNENKIILFIIKYIKK